MSGQNLIFVINFKKVSTYGVVRLNNGGANLWCWVDGELQLGFLSVINRQTFHQQGREPRDGTSAKTVEDQESLKSGASIGNATNAIQNRVDDLFTDGIVSTCVVVGSVFFSSDELFRVEKLFVGSGADFI